MDYRRLFGRWDLAVVVLVLLLAAGSWFVFRGENAGEASEVRVTRLRSGGENEVVERITLPADVEMWIDGEAGGLLLRVSDREAEIVDSECSQLICVDTGKLRTPGDRSICVPNGLIVELVGDEEPYDHILR
ncbi:MAG: NusG domain II-containing protein [Bacillota bacterium]